MQTTVPTAATTDDGTDPRALALAGVETPF